jgi:hypothetical protein
MGELEFRWIVCSAVYDGAQMLYDTQVVAMMLIPKPDNSARGLVLCRRHVYVIGALLNNCVCR